MKNAGKWMLGAAVAVGALGLAATPAKAAEIGIYVGGPAAYVPPCPGPGYAWVAGYYANGYWVPGRWNFAGFRDRVYAGRRDVAVGGGYGDHYRGFDRGRNHFRDRR